MSLLDNHQLKIVTNVQITIKWYQIKMTSIQEVTQVPITHVGQSHPAISFNGGHPLNVFAKQTILNSILNTLQPNTMFVGPFSDICQCL